MLPSIPLALLIPFLKLFLEVIQVQLGASPSGVKLKLNTCRAHTCGSRRWCVTLVYVMILKLSPTHTALAGHQRQAIAPSSLDVGDGFTDHPDSLTLGAGGTKTEKHVGPDEQNPWPYLTEQLFFILTSV